MAVGYGSRLLDLTPSLPRLTYGTKLNKRVDNDVTSLSPVVFMTFSFVSTGTR